MIRTLSELGSSTITTEQERDLIATVQNVDSDVITSDDGSSRTVYYATRAAIDALELLTSAYVRSIKHAANSVHDHRMSVEDALGVASEAFITCVREFDLSRNPTDRLSWIAPMSMKIAVQTAAYGNSVVNVSTRHIQRYNALMREVDNDVKVAYELCKNTTNDFSPSTFLAVHNSQKARNSLVPRNDHDNDHDLSLSTPVEDALARVASRSAESSVIDHAYVEWLFTCVTSDQARCLRLAYGFDDAATNKIRSAAGFREAGLADNGGQLPDGDVGTCLGKGRITTQRLRQAGLNAMRDAIHHEMQA